MVIPKYLPGAKGCTDSSLNIYESVSKSKHLRISKKIFNATVLLALITKLLATIPLGNFFEFRVCHSLYFRRSFACI